MGGGRMVLDRFNLPFRAGSVVVTVTVTVVVLVGRRPVGGLAVAVGAVVLARPGLVGRAADFADLDESAGGRVHGGDRPPAPFVFLREETLRSLQRRVRRRFWIAARIIR